MVDDLMSCYADAIPELEKRLADIAVVYEEFDKRADSVGVERATKLYSAIEEARDLTVEQVALLKQPAEGTVGDCVSKFLETAKLSETLAEEIEMFSRALRDYEIPF